MGIIIDHYKDPYSTTNIIESKRFFFHMLITFFVWPGQGVVFWSCCFWFGGLVCIVEEKLGGGN